MTAGQVGEVGWATPDITVIRDPVPSIPLPALPHLTLGFYLPQTPPPFPTLNIPHSPPHAYHYNPLPSPLHPRTGPLPASPLPSTSPLYLIHLPAAFPSTTLFLRLCDLLSSHASGKLLFFHVVHFRSTSTIRLSLPSVSCIFSFLGLAFCKQSHFPLCNIFLDCLV